MIICKIFNFEAAHQLPDKDIYGKCSHLHGHSYELRVEIEGEVTQEGWVVNFKDLKELVEVNVIKKLDHSFLNDIIEIPTAENLLLYIQNILSTQILLENNKYKLLSLMLFETKNSYAKINL